MENPLTTLLSPVYGIGEIVYHIESKLNSTQEDAEIIVTAIGGSKELIPLQDVVDFEQGFGYLKPENVIFRDDESGYKPSELAFILKQSWWRGNMSGCDFKEELESAPTGSILVRFSGERSSSKKAFVIGIKLKEVQLWKYIQDEHGFIIVEGRPYRLLQDLISEFAAAQGYPLEGDVGKETYVSGPCINTRFIPECIVCMDAPRQILLVPCNHVDVCESCSEKIEQCPSCRTPIESRSKVFLS